MSKSPFIRNLDQVIGVRKPSSLILKNPFPEYLYRYLFASIGLLTCGGIVDLQVIHAKQALTPSGWQLDGEVMIAPTGRIGSVGPASRASAHTGWKRLVRHRAYDMERYSTDHHSACRGGSGLSTRRPDLMPRPDVQTCWARPLSCANRKISCKFMICPNISGEIHKCRNKNSNRITLGIWFVLPAVNSPVLMWFIQP
jgi:hypothetical protein